MARVTVEDCVEKIPNRFRLVLLAAQRARQLASGELPTLPRGNDKITILSLREIATGSVAPEDMSERLISSRQKQRPASQHAERKPRRHVWGSLKESGGDVDRPRAYFAENTSNVADFTKSPAADVSKRALSTLYADEN